MVEPATYAEKKVCFFLKGDGGREGYGVRFDFWRELRYYITRY